MQVAKPVSSRDVADLIVEDRQVICVHKGSRHNTWSVNAMSYEQAKRMIEDPEIEFYEVTNI